MFNEMDQNLESVLRMAIPSGRIQTAVQALLGEAGIDMVSLPRNYRPQVAGGSIQTKILKSPDVLRMLNDGTRDIGFAGADMVLNYGADVVQLLDTGEDQVRVVIAAPPELLEGGVLPPRPLRIASAYPGLVDAWQQSRGRNDKFVQTYGSTEVYPPDDADAILEITATGETLRANNLQVVEIVGKSTTRLYASRSAMADPVKRELIDNFTLSIKGALDARKAPALKISETPARRGAGLGIGAGVLSLVTA